MIWLLMIVPVVVAIVVRLVTARERLQIWTISVLVSLLFLAVGSVLQVNEESVSTALGVPNVAYLLSSIAFVVAAAAVVVYMHTLRNETPDARRIAAICAFFAGVSVAMAVLWAVAPIHAVDYPKFRLIPLSPPLVAFELVYRVPYIGVMLLVASTFRGLLVQTPASDPARRIGLLTVSVGCLLNIPTQSLYILRAVLNPWLDPATAQTMLLVGDLFTLFAALGAGLGSACIIVLPGVGAHLRSRRLVRELRPLWRRVLATFPEVGLPGGDALARRPALQAQRMLIEIGDGVRLVRVSPDSTAPYDAIVSALCDRPATGPGLVSGSRLLPVPRTRAEEEQQAVDLADRYRELAHAS